MGRELLGSLELNRAYQMDCLEGMKLIPDKSIVIQEVIGNIFEKLQLSTIENKLDEAKRLFKEQILSSFMMVTKEHEEKTNKDIDKIINLIYESCLESLRGEK